MVLSGRRGPRPPPPRLLNVHRPSHQLGSIKRRNRRFGLLDCVHRDKGETARVLGVRVAHDLAFLDATVLAESLLEITVFDAGGETRNVEVVSRVESSHRRDRLSPTVRIVPLPLPLSSSSPIVLSTIIPRNGTPTPRPLPLPHHDRGRGASQGRSRCARVRLSFGSLLLLPVCVCWR